MLWALPEIVLPLIIAFLIGLLIGWLWWGWRRTKISYTEWETMRQKSNRASSVDTDAELQGLRSDLDSHQSDLDALRAERDELQASLDECNRRHEAGADAGSPDGDSEAGLGGGVLAGAAAAGAAGAADGDGGDHEVQGLVATTDGDAEADADGDGASRAVVGGVVHPYGDGSHAPWEDDKREQPEGYPIKGNVDSMLYHRPDSRNYGATGAEVWFDTADSAETAGFALSPTHPKSDADDAGPAADAVDTEAGADAGLRAVTGKRHPYGAGSHAPFAEAKRDQPDGYPIKGNVDSMLYHRPDSRNYGATGAEVWFDTPDSAETAGFSLSPSHPSTDLPDGMTFAAAPTPSAQALADDGTNDTPEGADSADSDEFAGEQHPYGEGSHAPYANEPRRMPEGYTIKGNVDSMLYHREDSRNYGATIAEVWFDTAERAEAAGFALSPTHPKS